MTPRSCTAEFFHDRCADLRRRMDRTMQLIDAALDDGYRILAKRPALGQIDYCAELKRLEREADGYPSTAPEDTPCDACGGLGGREWPECPEARDEVLCPGCFIAVYEPTQCDCGREKDPKQAECDQCAAEE